MCKLEPEKQYDPTCATAGKSFSKRRLNNRSFTTSALRSTALKTFGFGKTIMDYYVLSS